MAASADVIEMHAAIEQVLAELESIPSLTDEQKAALEAFKRSRYTNGKDPVPTCCSLACLDALLSRHTLR